MPKFYTAYDRGPRRETEAGRRMRNDYELQMHKGKKVLVKIGEHNQWEEIQSYKEECLIENILARAAAGDLEVLNKSQGIYADISETPKNLIEAQRMMMKLRNHFRQLPQEIRDKFNNNPEEYIAQFGSEEFNKKVGVDLQTFTPEMNPEAIKENIITPDEKGAAE